MQLKKFDALLDIFMHIS